MYKYKFLQAGQLPREHLPFLQNLLNFFTTKYLNQVDSDLSISMYKRSTCGLTGDIRPQELRYRKGNDVAIPNGEVPYHLLSRSCFYCPNLITAAPL